MNSPSGILACAVLLLACGGDAVAPPDPPDTPDPPEQVAQVTVGPGTANLVLNQTVQLNATVRGSTGSNLTGRSVSWTTNAPNVATVAASGLVTAIGPGSAQITARVESVTGTAVVSVADGSPGQLVLPEGVALNPTGLAVMSAAGSQMVDVGGHYAVQVIDTVPAQFTVATTDGKAVLIGFVDGDGAPQLSTRTTARALLYYAVGGFSVPQEHQTSVLDFIAGSPQETAIDAAFATAIRANPTALADGDANLVTALQGARDELLGTPAAQRFLSRGSSFRNPPRSGQGGRRQIRGLRATGSAVNRAGAFRGRVATVTAAATGGVSSVTNFLITPLGTLQSGVELVALDGGGIAAQNHYRRPGALLAYRTGYEDGQGTFFPEEPPLPVGGVIDVPGATRLSVYTALNAAASAPWTPVLSEPLDLPAIPGAANTFYEVGPALNGGAQSPIMSDPRFAPFQPQWDSLIDQKGIELFFESLLVPMTEAILFGSSAALSSSARRTIVERLDDLMDPVLLSQLKVALRRGDDYTEWVRLLFDEMRRDGGTAEKYLSLVTEVLTDGQRRKANLDALKNVLKVGARAASILAVIDVALQAGDAGGVIVQLRSSRFAEPWEVIARLPRIRLQPDPGLVTPSKRSVDFAVSVDGFPSATFEYTWKTTAGNGNIFDDLGGQGPTINTLETSVQYVATAPLLPVGVVDAVSVDVGIRNTETGQLEMIGTASTEVRHETQLYEVTLLPSSPTIAPGGQVDITAVLDPVPEAPGVFFAWTTTGNQGGFAPPPAAVSGSDVVTFKANPNGSGVDQVTVEVLDQFLNVVGSATVDVLVIARVPSWRLTTFTNVKAEFGALIQPPAGTWLTDENVFRTLEAQPGRGLIAWQAVPLVTPGKTFPTGVYLQMDNRAPLSIEPGYDALGQLIPLGRTQTAPPVPGAGEFHAVSLDALVESGSLKGQAMPSVHQIPPGNYALVIWRIDATVLGSTLSGTIERIQNVIDVQRTNCKPITDCKYIVTQVGTIEHRWTFTAERVVVPPARVAQAPKSP